MNVSLDYFLYSCFEFEKTSKAVPETMQGPQRWPTALALAADPESRLDGDFKQEVQKMLSWYLEAYPKVKSAQEIGFHNISDVVPAIVMILKDAELLIHAISGNDVPLVAEDPEGYWNTVRAAVSEALPSLAEWFWRYTTWSHSAEVIEEDEEGSRPPIGRYAPPPPRRPGMGRGGDRRDRPHGKGPARGGDGGRRPQHQSRGGGQRGGGPGRDRPRGRDRDRPREKGPVPGEQEILQEVEAAVAKLKNNPSVQEVPLKPTNSFFRHMQHSQIKDAGFESRSIGEGSDRAVVVLRPEGKAP